MNTSDKIQSEMIEELNLMKFKFERYYSENSDNSITEEAVSYRSKMKKFGFKHNPIVKYHSEIESKKKQLDKINEIALAINFYKEKFPIYQVIPLQLMIKISEKYDLFFSQSKNFIGDIPLDNLDDLEKFIDFTAVHNIPHETYDILKITIKSYYNILTVYGDNNIHGTYGRIKFSPTGFYITAPRNQFSLDPNLLEIGRYLIEDQKQSKTQFEEIYKNMLRPKDPIIWAPVSFPMPGGACMIISKWGEEAKYPEFINPIDN